MKSTKNEWAARVEAWKMSGVSVREYAEREGLKPRSLQWWSWKLRSKASAPRRTRARRVGFVELQASPAAAAERESVELTFPSGHVLRIPIGMDEDTMMSLVTTVGSL
jgi:hypothetical protein